MDFGQNVLLVAVIGYGSHEDVQMAMHAGFDLHLTKPADPALRLVANRDESRGNV